jgi:phosphopantetheinyl transferase
MMTVCGLRREPGEAMQFSGDRQLVIDHAYHRLRSSDVAPIGPVLVRHRPSGAPYLPGLPSFFCSISHSAGAVVATVAVAPIGIDIERVRPHDRRLLDLITTRPERYALRELVADENELITLAWALKEAAAKAAGVGVTAIFQGLLARQTGLNRFEVGGWQVVSHRVDDFFLALAFQENADALSAVCWHRPACLPVTTPRSKPSGTQAVRSPSLRAAVS